MEKFMEIEGDRIPLVGLGTYGLNGQSGIQGVIDAIEIGYRHFDTAQMYNNEREVGKGIRESGIDRKECFITTKISAYNLDPESIIRSGHQSVDKLGTDYADLLLIHWPTSDMDLEACLHAMMKLKEEGVVKHLGVSNFTPNLFKRAISVVPVICNQVEFSPWVPEFGNLEVARDNDLMITAYSPLGKGKVKRDSRLSAIGDKYGKTPAQVALRWLLQLGNVTVIPKASDENHRRENFDVFDFALSREDMDAITHSAG